MNVTPENPSGPFDYGAGSGTAPDETSEVPAVAVVKRYIEEHYNDTIKLDDLARLVGLTRFSLSKRFRQRVGVSPYQYVCQVRVRRAQAMMREGRQLTEIAGEVGFFDQSHLARHFKRLCGITPRQYRSACDWPERP